MAWLTTIQYIPRNMHTVFAFLCFVVVIHWLIFPYPSGLLHWHCGNLTIAPVPAKQPWWIWINTSCEFIMNDWVTTTKHSTTKPCAFFLGYTVHPRNYVPALLWLGTNSFTHIFQGCFTGTAINIWLPSTRGVTIHLVTIRFVLRYTACDILHDTIFAIHISDILFIQELSICEDLGDRIYG